MQQNCYKILPVGTNLDVEGPLKVALECTSLLYVDLEAMLLKLAALLASLAG